MKVNVSGKEYTLSKIKTGPMLKILPRLDGDESVQAADSAKARRR